MSRTKLGVVVFLLMFSFALWGQTVAWTETFDTDPGTWTLDSNWSIGGGELKLNWNPSVENYDLSAISPEITLPENVGDVIISQYIDDYSDDTGEMMEISVIAGGEDNVVWSYNLDENDDWGVTGGEDLPLSLTDYAGQTIQLKFRSTGGTTYNFNFWHIYQVDIMANLANDMAALTVTGNVTPTVGQETNYTVTVKNTSSNPQSDYIVKLMGEGDVELNSVAGPALDANAEGQVVLAWTPETAGNTFIYGKVILEGDEFAGNDVTPNLNIGVQNSGTTGITIGNGQDLQNHYPINFFWKSSLSETMYYPEEIQAGGLLEGIQYYYNFAEDLPAKQANVWVGETTAQDFSAGWIPSTELTQVFSGTLDYVTGDGSVHIVFDTPIPYTGGNLVVLLERPLDGDYYSSSDKFYTTTSEDHPNRSICYYSDSTPGDPTAPPEGTVESVFPNCTLFMNVQGMGTLNGDVVDADSNPLANVTIHGEDTNLTTMTDANGHYNFAYFPQGDYNITASLHGYVDNTQAVTVVEDETSTLDFSLVQLPTVNVTGTVTKSDTEELAEGADISLVGYDEEYTATTDASGAFAIPGVYSGHDYVITVHVDGYQTYTSTVNVGDADVDLPIVVDEVTHPARDVVATVNDNNADITWRSPADGTEVVEFRWDDGVATSQLGFGSNPSSVLGSSHMNNAVINEVSWYLTSEAAHTEAVIYLFGLDETGMPDVNQLLFESDPVPNVDDQWNTYTLPAPINAPNGFFVGICTPNIFTAIATDDGVDEPYVFQEGTQWGIADWTDGSNDWLDVGPAGFPYNFLVRAQGIDNGPLARNNNIAMNHKVNNSGLTGSSLNRRVVTGTPAWNSDRTFESYSVYRLLLGNEADENTWTEIASAIPDTNYTDTDWASLETGLYEYAVKANFSNNVQSDPAFSNWLPKDMTSAFDVNVTTNVGDDPEGADVHLVCTTADPDGNIPEYDAVVTNGTAHFDDVWNGIYDITVSLAGFDNAVVEGVDIVATPSIDVELQEAMLPPANVTVVENGDNADVSWSAHGGSSATEFRWDDGIVTGQLGFGSNPSAVLGSSHMNNAVVNEVSWLLTSEAAHSEAVIYLFGLDETGMPDVNQLLFESDPVPNVDDQWNTYTLPTPINAPNGFFVGICTPNVFTALGTDDGVDEPYVFQEGTQWGIGDWTDGSNGWLDIGPAGFPYNFLVRAIGTDNGALDRTGVVQNNIPVDKKFVSGLNSGKVSRVINAGTPNWTSSRNVVSHKELMASRAVINYNVYRLLEGNEADQSTWTDFGTVDDTTYTDTDWASLESGTYKYAVIAHYAGGDADPAFSNVLPHSMTAIVTLNISNNAGDPVEGATVSLVEVDGDHTYDATVPANGVVELAEVWKSTYDMTVHLTGFENYTAQLVVEDDLTQNIELQENVLAPVGLDVQNQPDGSYRFMWQAPTAGGDEFAEGFEGGVIPEDWTVVDADGDSYNWDIAPDGITAHTGDYCVLSSSYINGVGVLTPDNFLITPQIQVGGSSVLDFWECAQDPAWAAEHYYVKVSTTGTDPADFTNIIHDETLADGDWHEVTISLADFAGQQVYLAFEHCEVTDMFAMKLDDISVGGATKVASNSHKELTNDRHVTGYKVYMNGNLQGTTTDTYWDFSELESGNYTAGVKAIYSSGSESDLVTIDFVDNDNPVQIPKVTKLNKNYPNPFNPETTISYSVKNAGPVSINIFNIKGQKIRTLVNEDKVAGNYKVVWKGLDNNNKKVASGIYFYRMKSGNYTSTKKMILMK